MCGINGFSFNDEKLILGMIDKTHHRGPDDEGILLGKKISFGHNRLSIIDLSSAGHQPMTTKDGNFSVIFNGEIYNFLEIKNQLKVLGCQFGSQSDTEVLLLGWQKWGEKLLEKINGIFSFAIWDHQKEELFLARDHFGVKPLYYYFDQNKIIFSSEIKAILLHDIKKELDFDSLNIFFRFLYIPAPKTAFKNIYKLSPGYFIKWRDGNLELKKYYQLDCKIKYDNYDQAKKDLRNIFDRAVEDQMVSDRPLGLFLSGGFDSTAILGSMSRIVNHPIETFSVSFQTEIEKGKYNADANLAQKTAKFYHTNHHQLDLSAQDVENNFFASVYQMDDLVSNHIQVANYLLAKFAKDKVAVVFGGDGGDELFAGYERYYLNNVIDIWQKIPQMMRDNFFLHKTAKIFNKEDLYKRINIKNQQTRFFDFMTQKEADVAKILTKGIYNRDYTLDYFAKYFKNNNTFVQNLLLTDFQTWLPDESLVRSDKMSMAHGLEYRVPILDKRMVEFAFSIPNQWKVNRRDQGKKIFIDALVDYFPDYLLNQPKRGWFSPAAKWLRGDLQALMKQVLSTDFNSDTRDFFDWHEINMIVDNHLTGKKYNLNLIWALMTFQVWYKQYFK